jgi:hypothetical protein
MNLKQKATTLKKLLGKLLHPCRSLDLWQGYLPQRLFIQKLLKAKDSKGYRIAEKMKCIMAIWLNTPKNLK